MKATMKVFGLYLRINDLTTGIPPASHGQAYFRKVAENFGQCVNFSAREIEHGRFRALFAGSFRLICRMVDLHPKTRNEFTLLGKNEWRQRNSEVFVWWREMVFSTPGL